MRATNRICKCLLTVDLGCLGKLFEPLTGRYAPSSPRNMAGRGFGRQPGDPCEAEGECFMNGFPESIILDQSAPA